MASAIGGRALMGRSLRTATIGAAALSVALLGGGAFPNESVAAAGPWTVSAKSGQMRATVAGFNGNSNVRSLGALIRIWGSPANLRPMSTGCRGVWRRPTAKVELYNFASPGRECTAKGGFVQRITTSGSRWRTSKGLRIGAPVAAIRKHHPRAIRARPDHHGKGFLLEPFFNPMMSGQDSPIVALVRNGKVVHFQMWIGGAGE